ncbi:MAG: PAS domain S-box protein [Dehalococcoidales bacterium]|nr:PAS domain S-box protein [Dehalococcoidales bacterium]
MRDSQKTRKQLISELQEARRQLETLAAAEVERKKAGRDLNQSEDKFYKAFLSSPDMIIISSIKDSKYVDVNDSFVRNTGYSREELIGHTVDEFNLFVSPEEQAHMMRILQKTGSLKNEEYHFRVRSGEIRTWLCSAEIIDLDGDECMIAVATDVTELRKMENALRESESKLAVAFRSSPQAISITTLKEGKFLEANDSLSRMTGYTHDQLIGHTSAELNMWVSETERKRIMKILEKKGRVDNEELEFYTKAGDIQTLLFSAEKITIGGEECIISSSTDVTGLKKIEQALRDSEEKFSIAFRASPQVMSITRLSDGVFKEINESFCRILGFSREEVIGRSSGELGVWVTQKDREDMVNGLKKYGRVSNKEYLYRTKSGDIRTMLWSSDQIELDGEPCVLAVTVDITDYKRIEAQALEAENLKQLDKLRTELLANVSHELRTPLASIKGFATMLIDYGKRLKSGEKREYLETIDKNADRLVELIEQLLEMSRLGVGMFSIRKSPADIFTLCQTVISEASIRSSEHIFKSELPASLPKINIDERRIRQVLDNIIDNAVKYSNPGMEITLSLQKVKNELLFTVTDHGAGIPKKDIPRLFQRMFHSTRGQKFGVPGAGLGLSMCKRLIEAHGGRIWIDSQEGAGTRCYFTLPLEIAPDENNNSKSRRKKKQVSS